MRTLDFTRAYRQPAPLVGVVVHTIAKPPYVSSQLARAIVSETPILSHFSDHVVYFTAINALHQTLCPICPGLVDQTHGFGGFIHVLYQMRTVQDEHDVGELRHQLFHKTVGSIGNADRLCAGGES